MPTFWQKAKSFLCCGEAEHPPLNISGPSGFMRVEVDLPGLSENERALINSRPIPVSYPIKVGETESAARLSQDKGDCRTLSETIKSATSNTMSTVGVRGSGYSALANESSSMMQPLDSEDDAPHEMKELLPRGTGGAETTSSIDTVIAGCEEDEDRAMSSVHRK
ncbi:hypothetical protein QM012_003117 [Aureobasidium pullulans]|uniref:SHSP domain-containing protein n=1 Tax=Aureobasidium pullulans TaxID=5580 RepID=A0ABR0T9H4_AURPU